MGRNGVFWGSGARNTHMAQPGTHVYSGRFDHGLDDKNRLTIPSALGYGPHCSPPKIPPNATLLFDVELLEIK